jgi:hypothetical protein
MVVLQNTTRWASAIASDCSDSDPAEEDFVLALISGPMGCGA